MSRNSSEWKRQNSPISYKAETHDATNRCDTCSAVTSSFVCTDVATSRWDKTLVRCMQSILEERKCKLVQNLTWRETNWCSLIRVDLNFVAATYTRCDKAACAYFVVAICSTNSYQFEFDREIDRSQRQNSVAVAMIFKCYTRRFVAAPVATTCRSDLSSPVLRLSTRHKM